MIGAHLLISFTFYLPGIQALPYMEWPKFFKKKTIVLVSIRVPAFEDCSLRNLLLAHRWCHRRTIWMFRSMRSFLIKPTLTAHGCSSYPPTHLTNKQITRCHRGIGVLRSRASEYVLSKLRREHSDLSLSLKSVLIHPWNEPHTQKMAEVVK